MVNARLAQWREFFDTTGFKNLRARSLQEAHKSDIYASWNCNRARQESNFQHGLPLPMYNTEETLISPTGLRYTAKQNGSPFQGMGGSGEMMSCIKCSRHKPRSQGMFKRYVTSLMFICFDCKPKKIEQ
jgi:hypothetical protein